jgi:ATP-dependent helicase Lhr and Lhr-like helicase
MAAPADTRVVAAEATLLEWFQARGWQPTPLQREVWHRYLAGASGLLTTPTGSGKTLAAFGGVLLAALREPAASAGTARARAAAVNTLWITPLRALAADTARALREPLADLGLPWVVALRTGDARARERRLAQRGGAQVIVTTPESLAVMLSYPDFPATLSDLRCVVVDEWHELLGNKRGVLLQLCLARLRRLAPHLRCWGLSASLGNLQQARDVLLPQDPDAPIVRGGTRAVVLETLLPEVGGRFPWAGHLGLEHLHAVRTRVLATATSIVFTNTRAQAELWHRALSSVWPTGAGELALHHGSLDAAVRVAAECGLRAGTVRCVVATSSLDLGVDFPAVDLVFQIGSPKGVARLLQRAGRAKHRPGEQAAIVCVPTQALELAEFAAARLALAAGYIEPRRPLTECVDVLAQHCVTLAVGGGFRAEELLAEVRGTHAFAQLSQSRWQQTLDFIVQGGAALANYPEYRKVIREDDGIYRVHSAQIARRHRLSIGTISSDAAVRVRFLKGGRLGSVEEQFVARLRPGDSFHFAGRSLTLVRLNNMEAYVRLAKRPAGAVPRWQGGRMPLSSELGREVQRVIAGEEAAQSAEMQRLAPLLQLQGRLSHVPAADELLAEYVPRRDGAYLMLYPFAGRMINEGIAALMSVRWLRRSTNTLSYAANDYGLVIAMAHAEPVDAPLLEQLLDTEDLIADLQQCANTPELARRQFREIARVAGLTPPSLPGREPRSARQLQASSGLIYDVLRRSDPDHILLAQADREMLRQQFELERLRTTLTLCNRRTLRLVQPRSLTPLSFPLWAERWRGELSTEKWLDRVSRAARALEERSARKA